MPFLLMIFLTLACLPEITEWSPPLVPGGTTASAILTWLALAVPVLYAALLSRGAARRMSLDPRQRDVVLHRLERGRYFHRILLFGLYCLALSVLGWGWTVNQLWRWDDHLLPGAELVVLAPFLAGLVLSWTAFYDADRASFQAAQRLLGLDSLARAFHEPDAAVHGFASRAAYVGFQVRQKLALVSIPLGLLLTQKELQRQLPEIWREWQRTINIVGLCAVVAVFASMPLVIRAFLGLKPMPAGPLRDRLEAASRRLRFRCSDILLWNTNNGMANAMVIGLLPWLRYVVFTDHLLEEFTPEEVEAVFGHEVGHIKHHHMSYYLIFLLGSMAVLGTLATEGLEQAGKIVADGLKQAGPGWDELFQSLIEMRYLHYVPLVASLAAYMLVVFGFLSRRCERQADIYGCRAVSCDRPACREHFSDAELAPAARGLCPTGIRTFIRALEKVALVNGISRDRPGFLASWQHSTIGRRVEFLQRVMMDPAIEPTFQRRVALMKWGLVVVLGIALALIGTSGWTS